MQEKMTKAMTILVPPSLHGQFQELCERQYKTVSEVIRDFMLQQIKKEHYGNSRDKEDKRKIL